MIKKYFVIFFIITNIGAYAQQKIGFGCFGMVGAFGGYSYQAYNADGLNGYIKAFNAARKDSLSHPMDKFRFSTGYRVGINFFRASLKGLVITTKGFYQSNTESHSASLASASGDCTILYELNMNSWGLGFDLGASIFKPLVWKVLDASVLFNNVEYKQTNNFPDAVTIVDRYKEDSNLSYNLGTGFILSLIQNYLSLEGTIGYSIMEIKSLKNDENKKLPVDEKSDTEMDNFLKSGGLNAVLQVNISIPI